MSGNTGSEAGGLHRVQRDRGHEIKFQKNSVNRMLAYASWNEEREGAGQRRRRDERKGKGNGKEMDVGKGR